jgi:Domain of unknown function (DUF4142)
LRRHGEYYAGEHPRIPARRSTRRYTVGGNAILARVKSGYRFRSSRIARKRDGDSAGAVPGGFCRLPCPPIHRARHYRSQIANQQLVSIAGSEGIDTSGSVSQPEAETTANIYQKPNPRAARGIAAHYFRSEVALHQKSLKLYEREASSGSDARIRAYAKQQIPILKAHLQMAQTYLNEEEQ